MDDEKTLEKYHSLRTTDTHAYFWGSYLSNFYEAPFVDNQGQSYYTSEQYFMAKKALLFNDKKALVEILNTRDPLKCKRIGKKVNGFNPEIWDKHKYNIMVEACTLKFSQNPDIKLSLIGTGQRILVEASPFDRIWGIGLKWDDNRVLDENNWQGQNLLGKALMDVRTIINTPVSFNPKP